MNSNYFINNNKTIKDALYSLEKNKQKCLIVLDGNSKFFGTLTDGDVRRAILTNANINNMIKPYVRKKSFTIDEDRFKKLSITQVEKLINDYSKKKIYLIPIINKKGFVINFIDKDIKKTELNKVPLIVMAGGKGVRLKPFTDIFPKPLIPVDNIPAAEQIINLFRQSGINKIFFSVNFKKDLIKSYFKDKPYKINYIEEKKSLGTVGSLSFVKKKITSDFFVSNCDTILKINLNDFYDYHKKNNFFITIVVATKNFKLPYGSCELDRKGNLKQITEKPNSNYLVNAGLYLMNPKVIKFLKKNSPMDMDQLIKIVKSKKKKIGVYPISEKNWYDVGEWSEYNKLIFNQQ